MRPVLPVLALAALIALPASAGAHRPGGKSPAGGGGGRGSAAGASSPSALATPYDYGTGASSAKTDSGAATGKDKSAKAGMLPDDLAGFPAAPTGAAKKHGKAQALPAY